jgi:demethylmenaquinone methyltransferase/2-methoxy-6-polyprenyl-1,4-benzoquinol methylase
MPLLDHFGWIAQFYDRAIPLRHADQIAKHLDLPANGKLLDAGGGTGRVAAAFRQSSTEIYVADLSLKMLHQAKSKNGLRLICLQSEQLPFRDQSFERIIMVDALHHVYDQQYTVNELWRVLKKGGRIVIEEPDVRRFRVKILAVLEKLVLMRSRFLAPEQIAALYKRMGAWVRIETEELNAWIIVEKV